MVEKPPMWKDVYSGGFTLKTKKKKTQRRL